MDTNLYLNDLHIFAVLCFVAVMLLLESTYIYWRSRHSMSAKKLQQRLRNHPVSHAHPSLVRAHLLSELPLLERKLRGLRQVQNLERYIAQSGLRWTVSKMVGATVALAALAAFIAMEVIRVPTGLATGIVMVAAVAPWGYLRYRREKRMRKIEAQLPDALDLITRALRAGHAFTSTLKMVGEEMHDPIAGEFRLIHDETSFGVSLQQALGNFSDRVPLTDVRYFTVAVLIQRESGGNLTEVFSNLSRLVRARGKLMAKVRVLSSEGRMSAWIMAGLPFALGAGLYLLNPKFMGPMFTDPIGQSMLTYLLSMMAVGMLVLRRIVSIRY